MKIKKSTQVFTENDKIIQDPNEGFIVLGCIFKAEVDDSGVPVGGLIGDSRTADEILNNGVQPTAYTNKDFIRALLIDPYALKRIAEELISEK
jgi:hypothetical protein